MQDIIDKYISQGKTFREAINLAYDEKPRMQIGGIVKDNIPTFRPQNIKVGERPKDFLLNYINSDKYKERLEKSEYTDINKEILERSKKVNDTEIINRPTKIQSLFSFKDRPIAGSNYWDGRVSIDYPYDISQIKEYSNYKFKPKYDEVLAHEISHPQTFKRLNSVDNNNLMSRQKKNIKYPHDKEPIEVKADLDAFRYLLNKQGIYDTRRENFTSELLKKANNSFMKERLKSNYSDEDLIWLMNNVADNNSQEETLPIAQQGGTQYTDNELAFLRELNNK